MLFKLAWKSLLARHVSVLLTILMMTVSIFVLLSVETIRYQAKDSFTKTVSGVDLIVGARTGQVNLLLYSVFHIGVPTNNISWQSYQEIASQPAVAWTIPISLGDSHKGYRVIGTSTDFFEFFRFGNKQPLEFQQGKAFDDHFDAVIGSEVAKQLGYQVDDAIVLSHGIANTSFSNHDDNPFKITGILAPTGTPVDQSIYVSLQGIEAIHANWQGGVQIPGRATPNVKDLQPQAITAFMLGLNSRIQTFNLQRQINEYQQEPLLAILPGATLMSLWSMLSSVEQLLLLIASLVLLGALIGMANMLLVSMRERRHELSVLRALGYRPSFLFALLQIEALLISLAAAFTAFISLQLSMYVLKDWLLQEYGILLTRLSIINEFMFMLPMVLIASFVVALIPAITAYRQGLHQQLNL
ncbi:MULTISPECIES: ABC transporter permease [unclassified Methylophaga]|jgi:putative ABC transport system permease protein|uniref:ABC transporter permease n=1 Tax=unclassified Methylophaga TaxID=2629249 RepID=UPI000C899785|nr:MULTISPECIES: ABC transporter permease [unclassified Methylophaga]MAP26541.1 peptide ABC transporter permease [Methylophaga sp.]|tara:strand:+ start:28383 stop:29621 length:1239 start_codon:yes stop_codon:yes gene_type:complete